MTTFRSINFSWSRKALSENAGESTRRRKVCSFLSMTVWILNAPEGASSVLYQSAFLTLALRSRWIAVSAVAVLKSSVSGPMRIIGPAERTSVDSIEDKCYLERSFMQRYIQDKGWLAIQMQNCFFSVCERIFKSYRIFCVLLLCAGVYCRCSSSRSRANQKACQWSCRDISQVDGR